MPSLLEKSDLHNYQVYMAKEIKRRKTVLLWAEMSTGKTAATLTAIRRLLNEFVIRKVLVIAPLYVAENTWPEEIHQWRHLRFLKYSVVTGTQKQRTKALQADAEVYIINRENLPWLWKMLGAEGFDFDMVVYDESSRLKGGKHRTAKGKRKDGTRKGGRLSEFGALAKMRHKVEYVVELTGTPAPNGLRDLWGQAYIIDLGERLGGTQTAFLERWFDSDYMGYNYTPKAHAHEQIMGRLKDVTIGLRAEDYVELPRQIINPIRVNLPKKVMEEYKRFERTLVSEAYDVEAASKGVLTQKLLQFANGSMYREIEDTYPVEKEIVEIHDAKMQALESIISEANGKQVLVAYGFKFDLKKILKKYPKAVVAGKTENWKELWDSGKAGILLAHPAQIGHGLNLQKGGYIQVWYGLTWSLELWDQFNRRLARQGQVNPFVIIHVILARGTADETVFEAMKTKGATQDSITEVVRKRIIPGP